MLFNAIKELIAIRENEIHFISQIEWWLLKNQDNYKHCRESNLSLNSCFHDIGCACSMNSEEIKFISIYEKLNVITEFHRLEGYAKNELIVYKNIHKDKSSIKKWLIKNEKLASEYLACFFIDYLDYSENEKDNYNLLVYRNVEQKFEIFIQRNDFENLIEYKELFDELYYIKKLYPEGLKRIEEEINKLPKYIT